MARNTYPMLPAVLVGTGFGVLSYGGAKLVEASKKQRGVTKAAGYLAGGGAFVYGFYYASAFGLILALDLLTPPRS